MSKRRKAQITEEDKEMSISKAKKSLRRKTQLTGESNSTSDFPSNAAIEGTNEECKGSSPENAETDRSFTEEGKEASFQKKELDHTKVVLSPSQGRKLVPMFGKPRKTLTERHEKNFGEAATINMEQGTDDHLKNHLTLCLTQMGVKTYLYEGTDDHSKNQLQVQHMDTNVPVTAKKDVQNIVTSSQSLQQIDVLATKVEEAEDQVIFPCEELNETLNVKMQDQDNITKLNSDDASSGLVDSHEGIGIKPNLQVSICGKEMPEKHVTCTPDNNDVNGLEKRELSLESFKCPFAEENSVITCAKENIIDYIESNPNEEKHPSSLSIGMEQNKAIQDATDDIKEARWNKSERRKDDLDESMALQPLKERSITLLPLETNLSVPTPGEQSNCLCASSEDKQGSTHAREADQCPHVRTGKTEEENNICSTTEIFEPRATKCISKNGERATDQDNLWMHDKPIEQSDRDKTREHGSPHQIATEQNNIKDQDAAWKSLPEIQPLYIYLEKEGDICEPKCKQVLQAEGDILSKSRKISVQEIICNDERKMIKKQAEVKTISEKSIGASPGPKAAVVLAEQEKENSCENLPSDIKQSKNDAGDMMPNEIMETKSNTDVAQQNFTKIPKTQETAMENSLFSTGIHISRKNEIVTCVENESMPIIVESGLSSAKVLPVLETVDNYGREMDADMEARTIPLASKAGACAPNGLDTVVQTCTSNTDSPSLDLEFLPDSQLQGVFESHSLEFPLHKASILDNPNKHFNNKSDVCSTGEQCGTKTPAPIPNKTHPNNARDQMTEENQGSTRQEDATDVVCGLIKELSNLNRLTMNMHRDLDSFKRLKFRRNRQSSKLLPHSVNNMTSTLCIVRKKREL